MKKLFILLLLITSVLAQEEYYTEGIEEPVGYNGLFYYESGQIKYDLTCVANVTLISRTWYDFNPFDTDYVLVYKNLILTNPQPQTYYWLKPESMKAGNYEILIQCSNGLGETKLVTSQPLTVQAEKSEYTGVMRILNTIQKGVGVFTGSAVFDMFDFSYMAKNSTIVKRLKEFPQALQLLYKIIIVLFVVIFISPFLFFAITELYITLQTFFNSNQYDKKDRGLHMVFDYFRLHFETYWNILGGLMKIALFIFDTLITLILEIGKIIATGIGGITSLLKPI